MGNGALGRTVLVSPATAIATGREKLVIVDVLSEDVCPRSSSSSVAEGREISPKAPNVDDDVTIPPPPLLPAAAALSAFARCCSSDGNPEIPPKKSNLPESVTMGARRRCRWGGVAAEDEPDEVSAAEESPTRSGVGGTAAVTALLLLALRPKTLRRKVARKPPLPWLALLLAFVESSERIVVAGELEEADEADAEASALLLLLLKSLRSSIRSSSCVDESVVD